MLRKWIFAVLLLAGPSAGWAQVQVADAWVRATVAGQQGTGAFMTLKSTATVRIVGIASPVAGVAEIHEMKMDGDVMRMRPVAALELPAGRPVELKPGGYHVMLLDLKRTLKAGETVPLELRIETPDKKQVVQAIEAPVRVRAPAHSH